MLKQMGRYGLIGIVITSLWGCDELSEESESSSIGFSVEADSESDENFDGQSGEEAEQDVGLEFADSDEFVEELVCPPPTGLRPSAIAEMAGAHLDGFVYFFGGDNGFPIQCSSNPNPVGDLWKYDLACNQWELLEATSEGPGARTRSLGVLDSTHQRLLLFGGRYRAGKEGEYTIYNETWALDLNTLEWEQLPTTGQKPSPRWSTAGVYDSERHQLVITGGNIGTSGLNYFPSGDTFALDLDTLEWREIGGGAGPGPADRLFAASAYDRNRSAMVLVGGTTNFFGPMLNDVWLLDLQSEEWSLLHMGTGKAPEKRFWGSVHVDAENDRYVLFGGHDDGILGNRNDLWVFTPDAEIWGRATGGDEFNPESPAPGFCDFPVDFVVMEEDSPERRSMHLAVADEAGGVLIVGGKTDCGIVDDVWRLGLSNLSWEQLQEPTVGVSCERYGIEGCDGFCF